MMHPDQKPGRSFPEKKEKSPPAVRESSGYSAEEIIRLMQSPDISVQNDIFSYVYRKYRTPTLRFLNTRGCLNEDLAKELFQAAMTQLFRRRMDLYDKKHPFSTILLSFVVKQWQTHLGSVKSKRFVYYDEDGEEIADSDEFLIEDISLEESQQLDHLDMGISPETQAVRAALRMLTSSLCREAFQLEILGGLTRNEIAAILQRTPQTISNMKNGRCLEELTELLYEAGFRFTTKIKKQPGQSLLSSPTDPSSDLSEEQGS